MKIDNEDLTLLVIFVLFDLLCVHLDHIKKNESKEFFQDNFEVLSLTPLIAKPPKD